MNTAASRHHPRTERVTTQAGLTRRQPSVPTVQAPIAGRSTDDPVDIDLGHVSNAEARRLIRRRNREYFSKHIWNPALQQEFAGAYKLAHAGETSQEGRGGIMDNRYEMNSGPEWNARAQANANDSEGESDWGKSVRHALAVLQNRIANEDPRKFLRSRRQSALRVWRDAQKHPSDTQHTYPLSPTTCATPNSPSDSEEVFIARLLKEKGKIMAKHSPAPFPNLRHAAVPGGHPPMSQIEEVPTGGIQGQTADMVNAGFAQKSEGGRAGRQNESLDVNRSNLKARSLGCLGGMGGHGVRKLLAAERKR